MPSYKSIHYPGTPGSALRNLTSHVAAEPCSTIHDPKCRLQLLLGDDRQTSEQAYKRKTMEGQRETEGKERHSSSMMRLITVHILVEIRPCARLRRRVLHLQCRPEDLSGGSLRQGQAPSEQEQGQCEQMASLSSQLFSKQAYV